MSYILGWFQTVVQKAGALVGQRGKINFIEGSNITLTVADNSANDRVDITVASVGGGAAVADGPGANDTVDSAGAAGVSASAARVDHGHQLATSASTPVIAGTGAAGATGAVARSAHVHPAGSSADFNLTGILTPPQITANQNDYNPTGLSTATVLRLDTDALRNITGLQGGVAGRILMICNIGANTILFPHQNSSSAAANRFSNPNSQNFKLQNNQWATFIYDGTLGFWLVSSLATTTTVQGVDNIDAAGTAGTVGVAPGSGHSHEVDTSASTPAAIGTAAPGATGAIARSQHVHATGAGTPVTQAMGDVAAIGTGPAASMTDHKHGMPATAPPSGAAGGDLAGTYPNPTVAQVTNAFALLGDLTPPQITANQNDYNPTGLSTAAILRLNSDIARTITGLQGGADGRLIRIQNTGASIISLTSEDVGSAAANRFLCPQGLTVGLSQNNIAELQYDVTLARWIVNTPTAVAGTGATATIDAVAATGTTGDVPLPSGHGHRVNTDATISTALGSVVGGAGATGALARSQHSHPTGAVGVSLYQGLV